MAQDLLKISLESLVLQLPACNFATLKNIYSQLYQYLRNNGSKIPESEMLIIQRKITKIQGELLRRTKLGKDFHNWERKLAYKLTRG